MKRRVLTPYKILAVALSSAACTTPVRPAREVAEAPTTTSAPPPTALATPAPEEPADTRLAALQAELEQAGTSALDHQAHFRPLCDRDGYPLVGNVMRKGPPVALQPSELCARIRAKQAAR